MLCQMSADGNAEAVPRLILTHAAFPWPSAALRAAHEQAN